MQNPKSILDLQTKDNEIQVVQSRLTEITAQLSDESSVSDASKIDEAIKLQYQSLSSKIRKLEGDNLTLLTQQKSVTTKIYGGEITSEKELTALQDELSNLDSKIEGLEDSLLSAMVDYDRYEEGVKKSEKNLSTVLQKRKIQLESITAEKGKLEQDLIDLQILREELHTRIPPTIYTTYERLRKSKNGLAVSLMRGERCSACNISVPNTIAQTVGTGSDILFCNSCQRILINDD